MTDDPRAKLAALRSEIRKDAPRFRGIAPHLADVDGPICDPRGDLERQRTRREIRGSQPDIDETD